VRRLARHLLAVTLGVVAALLVLAGAGAAGLLPGRAPTRYHLVAEDASAPLARVVIHYAPAADALAVPVWRQLFAVLPARVQVDVAVAAAGDFDRFRDHLARAGVGHLDRFHPIVVGHELTTWSRDRFAALAGDHGDGAVLAPPRVETAFASRAGDMRSPDAVARARYGAPARTSRVVFEGGDLAASRGVVFVGAEILTRSRGRARVDRAAVDAELRRHLDQRLVWLGDSPGEVPHHHVMMYMVPLDDHTVLVGDPRAGAALAAREPAAAGLHLDEDLDGHARRFDHVADLLAARGFTVERIPVVVLAGAGSYATYTNALFDREPGPGDRPVVYLPTYGLPLLDDAAAARYRELGYLVHPIDVSGIYQQNGSIGCLVNVVARAGA